MEGISLGWNCSAAQDGLRLNLRKNKQNGYKTCPFDMMITNYIGLCECINEDFKDFFNLDYLILKDCPDMTNYIPNQKTDEKWIYNTKYKFFFNHESPYHGNLYLNERWSSPYHFVENKYEKFIERYKNRIENFRYYLKNVDHINFIMYRYNSLPTELVTIFKKKYPSLKFKINLIYDFGIHNIGFLHETNDNFAKQYEKYYLECLGLNNIDHEEEFLRYDRTLLEESDNIYDEIVLINPKNNLDLK